MKNAKPHAVQGSYRPSGSHRPRHDGPAGTRWPDVAAIMVGDRPGKLGHLSAEQSAAVTAYGAAIAGLHSKIAFAPGTAGASVAAAYRGVTEALTKADQSRLPAVAARQ